MNEEILKRAIELQRDIKSAQVKFEEIRDLFEDPVGKECSFSMTIYYSNKAHEISIPRNLAFETLEKMKGRAAKKLRLLEEEFKQL